MNDESRDLLDDLADDFLMRYRRGERPALTEYTERHPEVADEIREVFPSLILMEQARPEPGGVISDSGFAFERSGLGKRLERLGDYRIVREVGRGGMGIVYEAEQESLGRQVALKVLPSHSLLDPRQLQRFEREARAAARLHHSNIVPVFGVGEQDGQHYYVMQFIQGLGLDQVLVELRRLRKAKRSASPGAAVRNEVAPALSAGGAADTARFPFAAALSAVRAAEALLTGPFHAAEGTLNPVEKTDRRSDASLRVRLSPDASPSSMHLPGQAHTALSDSGRKYWQSVARIGVQVADALAYASSQGVQHRDIKPSNLLLDTQGTVWVTDFGLAKATDSDNLTHTGDIVGTLRYMAPERLRGQSDERSDIYSLGITLYELITQRPAFGESDRTRLMQQIVHEEPQRPRTLEPTVPLDLETIVLKAITKDRAGRYPTAAEMAADLRRFLEDKPIRARRASRFERSWRWSRRNPMVASLSAALAALVAVLGAGLAIGQLLRTQRDRAIVSELRAKTAEGEVRDLLGRALSAESEVQIRSYLAQATAYRRSGQPGQRTKCLAELTKAMALDPSESLRDELRNEAIASMALVDIRAIEGTAAALESAICFDSSYNLYAFLDEQAQIHIRRVGDLYDLSVLSGLGQTKVFPSFSSNGQYLLASTRDSGPTQIWHSESGRAVFPKPLQAYDACVSADEHRVAVSLLNGSTVVYELPSGRELCRLTSDVVASRIALEPGGHRVALWSPRPASVQIWDIDTDSIVAELHDIKAAIHAVTWHPDGRHLALSLAEPANRAEIWDTVTRERVTILEGHSQDVTFSWFLRSGSLIVTASWDGTTRVWEAATARPLVAWPKGIVIAPDAGGRRLGHFWNNNQLQFLELISGEEYRTLASSLGPGQGNYWDCGISPDGRLLAVGMDDGVRVWDLTSSREVAYLPTDKTASPIFSSDGTELITSGLSGLLRWPLSVDGPPPPSVGDADPVFPDPYPSRQPDGEEGFGSHRSRDSEMRAMHLGPPRTVPLPIVPFRARSTRDGGTLALCSAQGDTGLIMDMTTKMVTTMIKTNSQTDGVVLSPDGRWVATIGWHSATVQVWDARTAALVKELPLGTMTLVEFSPDSQHLITSRSDEFCFWEIGSWRKVKTVPRENCPYPGSVAFSPDGSVMALELASAVVTLLDVETGRTLAKLEDPHHDRPSWMSFTPDGSRFVIISKYARTIHVWDLQLIRQQLATMGLDWGASSDSAHDRLAVDELPRVTVDLGDFGPRAEALRKSRQAKTQYDLAQTQLQSKRWPEAVAASKRAVELSQENATYRNNLAWLLATCPDPLYRDAPLAAKHAQKAVDLAPNSASAWNTLGVARYRVAEWQIAIDALTKAEELEPGTSFAHNAFFLAMAYSRLGEEDIARNWLDQAKAWIAENSPSPRDREVFERFRAEAEELLK